MKSSPDSVGAAGADRTELTIGELAARFGLATHVLRHWESVGLLTPGRRVNGRRRYSTAHLTRVAIIMRGREVGIGLDQLRLMLGAEDGADRRAVLRRHRDELDRRIAVATASRDLIDHALHCPVADFLQCPDFQRLAQGPGCRLDSGPA
ncbi:MerR family transcriptional regulator [Micromonospora sp. WMMD1102]|uniref:MerR family transcriptional regulator n=1 Tax=Micromonospora sp. WMMD1102 TaxID=3016105 RepID=UPI00241576EF|nr:MerR family transcriptional regulator [Micromonospora sp. WMMD1102]MDG4787387.1 MerR family transcriptional regulator [Micromonospora sp. WMMD1102]